MKKLLALVLALIMCVSCLAIFAGCNNDTTNDKNNETETEKPTEKPTEAPEAPATLDAAKTFLFSMYKDSASPKNDYDIVGKVMIGTTAFTVTWTVDSDKISIKESSKADFWTVDLPDANAEEFEYVLTATIKNAAGETVNVSIKRTMAVIDNTGIVTAPVADVAYKFFMEQVTLGQTLFALNTTQNNQGKYINTTNDPKLANDYFAEVVDGGFKFYTTADGVKLYVHAHTVKTEDGNISKYLGLSAEEASVWTYNADKTAWVVSIDNLDYYIGSYKNYATLSISETKHLTPESTGISSFPGGLMTKEYAETLAPDAEKELEIPTNKDAVQPVAGEKYTISMIQGNKNNAVYYLTGAMNGYYMATSTTATDAANAYVEEVSGGYNLYVIVKGAKKYINVVKSGTHTNNVFADTASTVWVWDATLKTLKAECEGELYVLGTDATGSYTTFGMVKAAEKNFYGQFVVSTNEDQGGSTEPDPNPNPNPNPEPTPEEIVNAAWALAPGATYGECTLTGVVTEITDAYSTQFKNVTFVIVVAGLTDKPITVYRAKGDCADKIAVGDTVTVTGTLLNFVYPDADPSEPGLVEFTSGCTLSNWVDADGGNTTPPTPDETVIPTNKDAVQPVAGEKYTISMIQGNKQNATYYLTGVMKGYYMDTSTNAADAANAYVEAVNGGYNLYVIAAGAKKYINVVKSGTHTNNVFEDTASTVWVWDATLKTLKAECEGEFYVLGTKGTDTYTTFGMVKAAEKNFYGQFVVSTNEDQGGSTEPDPNPNPNPNPEPDPQPPVVTDGLEITHENLFTNVEGNGYAAHDGDHTVEGFTVNTSNVMESNQQTGGINVIQLRKLADGAGTITVKNATVKKLTIRVVSSFKYENNVTVTLAGNALTLPDPSTTNAAATPSGVTNANNYAINYYDVVVELDAAATGDLVIKNTTPYAVYFAYIIIE